MYNSILLNLVGQAQYSLEPYRAAGSLSGSAGSGGAAGSRARALCHHAELKPSVGGPARGRA